MVRATAPVGGRSDIRMPRIRPWWEDRTWTAFAASVEARAASAATVRQVASRIKRSAAPIPELPPSPNPGPDLDEPDGSDAACTAHRGEVTARELDQIRSEATQLRGKLSAMRQERDLLHRELCDLHVEVPSLSRERDELLAAVIPLRAELADLQTKDQELTRLVSEIQALRHQKSSLDREILAELRRSTDDLRNPPRRRFDDS